MNDNNEKVYLYLYDEDGKYIDKEEAELDVWQSEIKGSPSYIAKAFATFEEPELREGFTPYLKNSEWVLVADPTLDDLKQEKIVEAKIAFASKRDAIRFITISEDRTYGFDTESEDITNFMAAWKAADISGSTMYKVWLNKEEKSVVVLTIEDFTTVFSVVRDSQFEAYAWLQNVINQIENCSTIEELNDIVLEEEKEADVSAKD